MMVGPFYRQVLDGKSGVFRAWKMFQGASLGVIDARFFRRLPDGTEVELDRFEVLGYAKPRQAPLWLWCMRSETDVERVVGELCRKLGPGADIRVVSRHASREGWVPGHRGRRNLCGEPHGEQDNSENDR